MARASADKTEAKPVVPTRITPANRKPLAPNLGEGHVVRLKATEPKK